MLSPAPRLLLGEQSLQSCPSLTLSPFALQDQTSYQRKPLWTTIRSVKNWKKESHVHTLGFKNQQHHSGSTCIMAIYQINSLKLIRKGKCQIAPYFSETTRQGTRQGKREVWETLTTLARSTRHSPPIRSAAPAETSPAAPDWGGWQQAGMLGVSSP